MKTVTFMKLLSCGHENPGGALEAEKWLLAGNCNKNNDFQDGPWGMGSAIQQFPEFLQLREPSPTNVLVMIYQS